MFAYIKGILSMKFNNYIVIEAGGIGYKIFMTQTAIQQIGNIGDNIKVHTYYYVREDNINLYGFITNEELKMFELLLSVSGIGAKSAIITLSNITPSSFALAVITNNTSKLVKIPGIGAKTAARIILELKDKLKTEQTITEENQHLKDAITEDNKLNEAISALQVLGYTKKESEKVVEEIDIDELSVEDLIKKALSFLGR